MKKIIALVGLFFALTIISPVLAEETTADDISSNPALTETMSIKDLGLANPSVLPGSLLYPLKTAFEKLQQTLTFNEESAMKLDLSLANKRLAEANRLAELGKIDKAKETLENYSAKIEKAKEKIQKIEGLDNADKEKLNAKRREKLKNSQNLFTESFFKHILVLERVKNQVPDEAKDSITKNIDKAKEILQERINNLNPDDADKAKEELNGILDQLPGTEIDKIEYLNTLNEIKDNLTPQLKEKVGIIETERVKKIGEFINNNKLTKEKQEKLLESLNKKIDLSKGKMQDLQTKIMKELPVKTVSLYNQIKEKLQGQKTQSDGSLESVIPQ